jgi:hypothetical protein
MKKNIFILLLWLNGQFTVIGQVKLPIIKANFKNVTVREMACITKKIFGKS